MGTYAIETLLQIIQAGPSSVDMSYLHHVIDTHLIQGETIRDIGKNG